MTSTITAPATATRASELRARTSPEARKPARGTRNPVIDGYRGLAAIGVVFGHAVLINQLIFNLNGREATYTLFDVLPMFFTLSGLMTYRVWVLGALSGRVPRRGATISARLSRILPVYYTIVLLIWAMRYVGTGQDWSDLILHLSFLQVWSPKYVFWLDGPAWFLADDMHFFLVAALIGPLLCAVALRFRLSRSGVALRMTVMASLPVLMISVGCFDIWWTAFHRHDSATWLRYTPLYTMPEFGFGMLLAVIMFTPGVSKVRPRLSVGLTATGFGSLAVIAYYSWRVPALNIFAYGFPLVSLACCLLLAGALMNPPTSRFSRVMGIKPLQVLATVGLTILLVQEPLMLILEKWGFMPVWDPTACWVSATLLLCVAGGVAWLFLLGIERPALRLQQRLRKLGEMQSGRDRRHRGPIPRMLPAVSLELPNGEELSVRSILADRPVLLAFGEPGIHALAEQRFRIDSGDSVAWHISAGFDRTAGQSEQLGAHVAYDPDGDLSRALNVPVALVEVGPDGIITSFQRTEREGLGAWT